MIMIDDDKMMIVMIIVPLHVGMCLTIKQSSYSSTSPQQVQEIRHKGPEQ